MMNDKQYIEKVRKVLACAKLFLISRESNEVIGNRLGISSSSVQRYLNDKEIISENLGIESYYLIQEIIRENKKEALSKGGKTSQEKYYPIRNDEGKFIGNRMR